MSSQSQNPGPVSATQDVGEQAGGECGAVSLPSRVRREDGEVAVSSWRSLPPAPNQSTHTEHEKAAAGREAQLRSGAAQSRPGPEHPLWNPALSPPHASHPTPALVSCCLGPHTMLTDRGKSPVISTRPFCPDCHLRSCHGAEEAEDEARTPGRARFR